MTTTSDLTRSIDVDELIASTDSGANSNSLALSMTGSVTVVLATSAGWSTSTPITRVAPSNTTLVC